MEASPDQIHEYESQLADVQALLEDSPNDEALLSLKKDLEELLALTKASLPESTTNTEKCTSAAAVAPVESAAALAAVAEEKASVSETTKETTTAAASAAAPSTKRKKLKDFEIPQHLQPKPDDTEADTNKKKRAVKKLKNKWREQKKEVESFQKQQSWQSFQSKTKRKTNKTSIFATSEGAHSKVGVISTSSMTEFGARKRHKHDASF